MTGLPGLPVGVAGLSPAGASPYLKALGGDSTDRQHSRHESCTQCTLIILQRSFKKLPLDGRKIYENTLINMMTLTLVPF